MTRRPPARRASPAASAMGDSSIRIIGGAFRGRRLSVLGADDLRPTTDRVREAIFNALGTAGLAAPAQVVDLFSGSGAMGLEALSRGAGHVTFVERNRLAAERIRENVTRIGVTERTTVVVADALEWLRRPETRATGFDLAFCDPPYRFDMWQTLCNDLSEAGVGFVVAETGDELAAPDASYEVVRSRRYSRSWVTFLEQRSGDTTTSGDDSAL